jgi:hypothetical protein
MRVDGTVHAHAGTAPHERRIGHADDTLRHAPVAEPPRAGGAALVASIAVHACFIGIVIVLGLDLAGGERRPAAPLMVADWTPPPVAALSAAPPELPAPGGALVVAGPALRSRVPTAVAAADAAAQLDQIAPPPRVAAEEPAPRLARSLGFGAPPADAPRAAGFADDRSRVAFVLDAGATMVPALQVALAELGRRLAQLRPEQTYAVVLARGDGCEVVPGTPAKATRDSLQRTARWLAERAEPRGAASLAEGLACAWTAVDPDAVCVISRGRAAPAARGDAGGRPVRGGVPSNAAAPRETLLGAAERLNPLRDGARAARVLCIELLDSSPESELRALGTLHGGPRGYQFLTRNELGLAPRPVPARSGQTQGATP